MTAPPGPALHALEVAAVAQRLGTSPIAGITESEAARRRVASGRNLVGERRRRPALALLAGQFTDVLVILLLVAAIVSGLVLGEVIDAGVILAIVMLNAALGLILEQRAERALARLRELAGPQATAIRAGKESRLAAADLVPGDLITLRAGDRVPADARVVEAHHLTTKEALLTGEAFPRDKTPQPAPTQAPLAERASMVHMGTTVLTGRGRALVTATGMHTAMGAIAGLLATRRPPTPLQRELAHVGRLIGVAALVIVAAMFLLGWLEGYPGEVMFLSSVALAVAAVPEGLPAVVTITLALGTQRLARQHAIVRRLHAVETLGAATVICTDKTGTLTENRIAVQETVLAGFEGSLEQVDHADGRLARYAEVAALCNDASPDGGGDPIEVALLWSLDRAGVDPAGLRAALPRVDELSFDSRRKLMTTLHRRADAPGPLLVAVKGAPEVVLRRCTRFEGPHGPEALSDGVRHQLIERAQSMASSGLRMLALAYRNLDDPPADLGRCEQDLVLVGLTGFRDQLRAEAAAAVRAAQQGGIRIVMVTGDHPATATAVARDLGILGPGQEALPGQELSQLTAPELGLRTPRYAVYSRVDPVDKVKIVHAWQRQGAVVAMTGDGVNDAPALHAADIGVAMGSGTDVSKDAAAMVLADDNFATLVTAVREGRAIFDNLRKVVRFLLTTNATEILVMAVGFLFFGHLGQPLLPTQILWVNLVTDGPPVLALGAAPADRGLMRRPPRASRHLIEAPWSMGWRSSVLAATSLGALTYGHFLAGAPWPRVQTLTFTTLVTVQLTYAFLVFAQGRAGRLQGTRTLMLATLVSLALQVAVVSTPMGNKLFHTTPMGWQDSLVVIALNVVAAGVIGLSSRFAARRSRGRPRPPAGSAGRPPIARYGLGFWSRLPAPARRVAAALVGGALVSIGVLLLILPGPGLVAIGLGLAILATEFVLPRRLLVAALDRLREWARAVGRR